MTELFKSLIETLGDFSYFCADTFRWFVRKPHRYLLYLEQFKILGVDSLPIIILVSLFTGMVFALQTTYAFRLFSAETLVGATVGLSLSRELAPVFASLMLTARVGSSMAAELGTMKVTEQIDALETMAVSPHQYLVVPRVFVGSIVAPLHTVIFNFVGLFGAYMVGVGLLDIPSGPFFARLQQLVDPKDVVSGVIKAVVFGFLLTSIACYQGLRTQNGARGVGLATTRAVVVSSVLILISDYFLTQLVLEFLL